MKIPLIEYKFMVTSKPSKILLSHSKVCEFRSITKNSIRIINPKALSYITILNRAA